MSGRVVMLIRPRRHSIHPAGSLAQHHNFRPDYFSHTDIHIILNTIHSPSIFNSPASASWLPICLPKFNPSGFLNMYVAFLRKDEPSAHTPADNVECPRGSVTNQDGLDESGIALVCIGTGSEFEIIRTWCDSVIHVRLYLPFLDVAEGFSENDKWDTRFACRRFQIWKNWILCFRTGNSWSAAFCLQVSYAGANNATYFWRPIPPGDGEETVRFFLFSYDPLLLILFQNNHDLPDFAWLDTRKIGTGRRTQATISSHRNGKCYGLGKCIKKKDRTCCRAHSPADHSAFRGIRGSFASTAEERCCGSCKCCCEMGQKRRSAVVLERCTGVLNVVDNLQSRKR